MEEGWRICGREEYFEECKKGIEGMARDLYILSVEIPGLHVKEPRMRLHWTKH